MKNDIQLTLSKLRYIISSSASNSQSVSNSQSLVLADTSILEEDNLHPANF